MMTALLTRTNAAVILSGVWLYFSQTESKDLLFRMLTYERNFWDTALAPEPSFIASNTGRFKTVGSVQFGDRLGEIVVYRPSVSRIERARSAVVSSSPKM